MTKYILHGGAAKHDTEKNRKFFREILRNLPEKSVILIACFAKKKGVWPETFERIKQSFQLAAPEKRPSFVLADAEPRKLADQIRSCQSVYLPGGNTHWLLEHLSPVPDIEKLWNNKTVAGSSAGALVLTRFWYENDDDTYNQGLGLLPFKLFCHYSEEKQASLEKLKAFGDQSETKTLAEEKYIVINK